MSETVGDMRSAILFVLLGMSAASAQESGEGALAIGRQADPLGLDAVKVRFEAAQGQATRTTSVPDRHLLFKAKGWFESVSEVPA